MVDWYLGYFWLRFVPDFPEKKKEEAFFWQGK